MDKDKSGSGFSSLIVGVLKKKAVLNSCGWIEIENDEEVRSEFKEIFFGKIFYLKNIEQENYLKMKFEEKYPTCYEAIFFLKGDKNYSEDYKKIPALPNCKQKLFGNRI